MDKKELKRKRIAVLYGGRSSEREISIKSGTAVLNGLTRLGYNATGIDAAKDLVGKLKKEKVDIAFIALHGRWGEDGTVQGLLEIMGIPYTGSGVLGSSMALDKAIMKLLFDSKGIPTPAYLISTSSHTPAFPLPYVVKPANEGSTIGISIVRKKSEAARAIAAARKYDRKIIVEEYVEGSEDERPWRAAEARGGGPEGAIRKIATVGQVQQGPNSLTKWQQLCKSAALDIRGPCWT